MEIGEATKSYSSLAMVMVEDVGAGLYALRFLVFFLLYCFYSTILTLLFLLYFFFTHCFLTLCVFTLLFLPPFRYSTATTEKVCLVRGPTAYVTPSKLPRTQCNISTLYFSPPFLIHSATPSPSLPLPINSLLSPLLSPPLLTIDPGVPDVDPA